MKTAVFWDEVPCVPVEVYDSFRRTCCLHNILMLFKSKPIKSGLHECDTQMAHYDSDPTLG